MRWRFALTCAVLAVSSPAMSETYWALNLGSYHFDRSQGLNETNLGFGYGRSNGTCGTEGGAYWNSHDKLALYGLGFCETSGQVRIGGFLGAASGYQDIPDNYKGVIPIAGVQLSAGPVLVRLNKEVVFFSYKVSID